MKKKIYLLTILLIFLSSLASVLLLFFYMNVETNMMVGLTIMAIASFLAMSSFFALTIYLFKRIYYRGEVYIYTIHSSVRQWLLLSAGIISGTSFYSMGVLNPKTLWLLVAIIILFELMIQSVSDH